MWAERRGDNIEMMMDVYIYFFFQTFTVILRKMLLVKPVVTSSDFSCRCVREPVKSIQL